jgi:hypothetical protein
VISRALRALFLAIWAYSMLAWLYIVLRIVVSKVEMSAPFIDAYPWISIWQTGAVTFVISFVAMFVYLAVWWRPEKREPSGQGTPRAAAEGPVVARARGQEHRALPTPAVSPRAVGLQASSHSVLSPLEQPYRRDEEHGGDRRYDR